MCEMCVHPASCHLPAATAGREVERTAVPTVHAPGAKTSSTPTYNQLQVQRTNTPRTTDEHTHWHTQTHLSSSIAHGHTPTRPHKKGGKTIQSREGRGPLLGGVFVPIHLQLHSDDQLPTFSKTAIRHPPSEFSASPCIGPIPRCCTSHLTSSRGAIRGGRVRGCLTGPLRADPVPRQRQTAGCGRLLHPPALQIAETFQAPQTEGHEGVATAGTPPSANPTSNNNSSSSSFSFCPLPLHPQSPPQTTHTHKPTPLTNPPSHP